MTESTTQRIGTAMAWSVAARAGRFVLGFASSVLVVRGLGDHDYGVLSAVRSVLMFVVLLAGFGTGQTLLRFLPALRVARAGDGARRLVRQVAVVHVVVWLVLVAAAVWLKAPVEKALNTPDSGVFVAIGIGVCIFEVLFALFANVLNAAYDTARLSAASLVSHGVYIAAIVPALRAGWGVTGILAAAAAGNLIACVMVLPRLRAALNWGGERTPDAISSARLWRYSLPFAAIGVLNLIVWRQSETLLLAHFRSPEETGYFDLAYRLPQTILEFVPGTVWPLVMAGMSESYARDPARLSSAVQRYYRMLFALCTPLCVLGALLGGRAVGVLFGAPMQPAAVPTQLFFLIFTVSFLSTPLSMVLYVLEKTSVNLLIYMALAVVNVGLDLLLIPRFGVPGAMVPVSIAIAAQPVVYYMAVRRYVRGISIPFGFIARCLAAAAPTVVVLAVLHWVAGVVGLVVAGVVAVPVLLWGYRRARIFGPDELAALGGVPVPLAARLARFLDSER
ncbi:MAG TPA: oligosaccharide flippase family protein [Candidatus Krumholzibacteria bacterium]|nr:oligosaccharide flippase family protein [Candidatus Krumholzibacteria bacterium]